VGSWSEFQFAERRMPTLDEINDAAPDTPVFVLHLYCRALLNKAALRACGYTKTRPTHLAEKSSATAGESHRPAHRASNAAILYATLAKGEAAARAADEFDASFHARIESARFDERH